MADVFTDQPLEVSDSEVAGDFSDQVQETVPDVSVDSPVVEITPAVDAVPPAVEGISEPVPEQEAALEITVTPVPEVSPVPEEILTYLEELTKAQQEQAESIALISSDVTSLNRHTENLDHGSVAVMVGMGFLAGILLLSVLAAFFRH